MHSSPNVIFCSSNYQLKTHRRDHVHSVISFVSAFNKEMIDTYVVVTRNVVLLYRVVSGQWHRPYLLTFSFQAML